MQNVFSWQMIEKNPLSAFHAIVAKVKRNPVTISDCKSIPIL